jgi:hypothetical protein
VKRASPQSESTREPSVPSGRLTIHVDGRLPIFYQPEVIENSGGWVETAVRPQADHAELQPAAAELLEETLGVSPGQAAEAAARWETLDAKPRRPLVKWAFIIVLAAVSA